MRIVTLRTATRIDDPIPAFQEVAPPSNGGVSGDKIRLIALVAVTAGLITLSVLVTLPFLPAITWGAALAIAAWPLHRIISRFVQSPKIAAAISTIVVMATIVAAGFFVTYNLARETANIATTVKESVSETGIRGKLASLPGSTPVLSWMERVGLDIETEARKAVSHSTQDLSSFAQGSLSAVIQFLVATFILFYLFLDPAGFRHGVRDILPLSREESNQVLTRAADSVYANLYANIVTSLLDAIGGGIMFWVLGISQPFLWGCVIFVLCFLPLIGNGLVWVPAAIFLAFAGRWGAAIALTTWGILTFVVVDNLLYFRLVGKRTGLHQVPTLVAFLGGLAVFGVSGMILGPATLAVTVALLEVWRNRLTREREQQGSQIPVA